MTKKAEALWRATFHEEPRWLLRKTETGYAATMYGDTTVDCVTGTGETETEAMEHAAFQLLFF